MTGIIEDAFAIQHFGKMFMEFPCAKMVFFTLQSWATALFHNCMSTLLWD